MRSGHRNADRAAGRATARETGRAAARAAGGAAAVIAAFVLSGLLSSCAGRIPLPENLKVSGTNELLARMAAASTKLTSYSAEARVTYFGKQELGKQERVRLTADLVAVRPASLRYDLRGPHGGVITAFAMNGQELETLDLGQPSQFLYGPATANNIDTLLKFAPLGLPPEGWVKLFFGEVDVPPQAELTYDDRIGRFVLTWEAGLQRRRVEVDPATSRPTRAQALASRDGTLISDISFDERNAEGLPTSLRLRVPAQSADVEIKLRDIENNPEIDPSVFTLAPPAGVTPQHLGSP